MSETHLLDWNYTCVLQQSYETCLRNLFNYKIRTIEYTR